MDPTARTMDELLRHERFVRRLARTLLRAPHEADDLVQETWLRAVEHPPQPGGSVTGWLGAVVRNLASDWRLGASRRAKREAAAAGPESTPPLQQVVERQELQRKVVAALARIPEAHASAIVLRYFDGLPPREIARRLSIPVATVKKRLTRGLGELRTELDGAFERGRAGWTAALPLLAGVPATGVAATATAVALPAAIAGGIIVSTKIKIACAAVVLVVGAFFATRALPRLEGPAEDPTSSTDPGDVALAGGKGTSAAATPAISPKPFREEPSESAPATAASDRLVVRVLDDEDRPVIGSVVVFRSDGTILHRVGDFDPRWPERRGFPAVKLPASIGVVPYSRPPMVEELSRGSGSITIRPRKGSVVSGRVLVNGSVPKKSIELRLYPVPPYKALDSWPPVIDRVMREQDAEAPQLRAWTDPKDGTFRFWGLHAEWRGKLWPPQGWRVEGDRGDVPLDKPESGLVVNLIEVPKLRGRVVSGPERAPESRVALYLNTVDVRGGVLAHGGSATGPDGRFEIPLADGEKPASGTLALVPSSGFGSKEIPLSTDDLARGRDLGDLDIPVSRRVAVRVSGPDGKPIPRTRVLVPAPEVPKLITMTAEDGRAEVQLPSAPFLLRFAASGYQPLEIEAATDATEIAVALTPATRVHVRAVLADGRTPAPWASVWLDSGQPVLEPVAKSEHQYFQPREPDWEATAWSANESGSEIRLGGSPVTISCVRAGIPITVWAHDTISGVKASEGITLGPAEQKTVVITLDVAARALRGKVVDPSGEPIYKADVALESNRRDVSRQVTNRDGSFSFDPITLEKVRMTVAVRGYARWIQEVAIAKEGTDVLVQLEAAEPVTFSVVDGRGKPAAGAFLSIPEINQFGGWRTDADGRFTLSSCPRGEHEIRVNFGWISVVERRRLPARSITITLPPFGSVEVLPLAGSDPRASFVRLVALAPGATVSPSLDLPDAEAPVVSGAIPVGSYRVELRERTPEGGAGKLLLAGPTIEVKDGEKTPIDLGSAR